MSLDQDRISVEPKRIRVRIETDGKETGCTTVPQAVPENAPIEQLILQARNTIYAEELWQEVNREARFIASEGVRAKGDSVTCPLSSTKTIVLDLVSLDTKTKVPPTSTDNTIAEAVSLALNLLLSYAHRQNYRRRTQPPPPLSAIVRPTPPYALLRPIISRMHHDDTLRSTHKLLQPICSVLKRSGIQPPPQYNVSHSPPPQMSAQSSTRRITIAENTISSLTDRLETVTTFTIVSGIEIQMKFRTSQNPIPVTTYALSLQPESNPLIRSCRPPPMVGSFRDVKEYILYATSCALAASFISTNASTNPEAESKIGIDEASQWNPTSQGNVLQKTFEGKGRSKQVHFEIRPPGKESTETELIVSWEWSTVVDGIDGKDHKGKGEGKYIWRSGDEGISAGNLVEVVKRAGLWED